ncbi:MAG: MmgE/PrpD family protein [Chloroflexota bacterium]
MKSFLPELAGYVINIKFEDLPAEVVHETKRALLDAIGCALAGVTSDKGKITIELSRRLGGAPEASVIGTGDKASCSSVAFANAELVNAWDYDTILAPPGHVSLNVIPPTLAAAESVGASGKDLIVATALAHEIPMRFTTPQETIGDVISGIGKARKGLPWSPMFRSNQCIFGGTAGAGKILKLGREGLAHALALAGDFVPVSNYAKWFSTSPMAMGSKYGTGSGWLAHSAMTAVLLASLGYQGDTTLFDEDNGVWHYFGVTEFDPEGIMKDLRERWLILRMRYKSYPNCAATHTALEGFEAIMEKNHLHAEDITSVKAQCLPIVGLPIFTENKIVTQMDVQFHATYPFACAAYRVPKKDWNDWDTIREPRLREFMKKVTVVPHPRFAETRQKYPTSEIGTVEVVAKGKTYREERIHPRGTPSTEAYASDEVLIDKFQRNASWLLPHHKIDRAVKSFMELETVKDTKTLMQQIVL